MRADTPWAPDFAGERYHARRHLGAFLSAGCNWQDWKGPRVPWHLAIDCHRTEAERLVHELGQGEAKARGSLDETWSYTAGGHGDSQADAQALAERLAAQVAGLLGAWRAS